ncbi:MAG: ABC transporter ATP-binding protein, partial [bacterium]
LLEVNNLKTQFHTDDGIVRAVDDISFYVKKGETLGIVGESGCGKSVSCLSVMRLIPQPPGRIESRGILYKNQDLFKLTEKQMRKIRGNEIAMIFQDPMTSLNPVFTCGNQVYEAIKLHQKLSAGEAWEKTVEMFHLVGIPNPGQRVNEYPHQMSGGMRQRVMIAMALSCNPSVLIADEPTTALDVTIQAQILELLLKLQQEFGMSIILITHDLGVISETADRIIVMYAGRIVEEGTAGHIFQNPMHPYTIGLLESLPTISGERQKLRVIPGNVPDLIDIPEGCSFNPRCFKAAGKCYENPPVLEQKGGDHMVSCWEAD